MFGITSTLGSHYILFLVPWSSAYTTFYVHVLLMFSILLCHVLCNLVMLCLPCRFPFCFAIIPTTCDIKCVVWSFSITLFCHSFLTSSTNKLYRLAYRSCLRQWERMLCNIDFHKQIALNMLKPAFEVHDSFFMSCSMLEKLSAQNAAVINSSNEEKKGSWYDYQAAISQKATYCKESWKTRWIRRLGRDVLLHPAYLLDIFNVKKIMNLQYA